MANKATVLEIRDGKAVQKGGEARRPACKHRNFPVEEGEDEVNQGAVLRAFEF